MKTILTLITALFGVYPLATMAQQFEKITTGPVVETPCGSRACIFVDFDRDLDLDIFISSGTSGGENNRMYLNNGDGTFSVASNDATSDNTPSDGAAAADFNNDGRVDLAVANWYGIDNLLYVNNWGAGSLMEKIDSVVVSNEGGYSEAASWGDYDNDGYLDLYITNSAGSKKNFLYRNLGNGDFQKIVGIFPTNEGYVSRSVNWIDVDRDHDLDLFVSNESFENNNLYLNDGAGIFTKELTDPLVSDNFNSFTSSWSDVDNDGDFDVFIGNYEAPNQLFLNDGTGAFTLVSGPWVNYGDCTFSSSFADYDNDGFQDLFVTNGYCNPNLVNKLYRNLGGGMFEEVLNEPIVTDVGASYGCAWGDYDNDGHLDLVVANWQNETQTDQLYRNLGNGNHWIKVQLEGLISNQSAIGAVVQCYAVINGVPQWQTQQITTQSGYCSQNSLVAHFGLGATTTVDSLVVHWPLGISDTIVQLEANAFYALIEGNDIGFAGLKTPSEFQGSVEVFPNPNSGEAFSVRYNPQLHFLGKVEWVPVDGNWAQSISVSSTQSGLFTIEKPSKVLENGMYYLKVCFEEGTAVVPILIQ